MSLRITALLVTALVVAAAVVAVVLRSGSDSGDKPDLATADTARVVVAGDIACDPEDEAFQGTESRCGHRQTAALAAELKPDLVMTTGDNQYEEGELAKYRESWEQSWGRFEDIVRPTPGNHEFRTPDGAGYFDYFNGEGEQEGRAGKRGEGWYSYTVAGWQVLALNSNCDAIGGCEPDSPQGRWLQAELDSSDARCTLAYWHHPVFSSGQNGSIPSMAGLFDILAAEGAELALAGHDHLYERFAPQDSQGEASETGLRSFVVGTGGKSQYAVEGDAPNSEKIIADRFGVMVLELSGDAARWEWRAVGSTKPTDSGTARCR